MAENKNLPQHDADHSIKLNPLPKLFGDDGISDNEDDLLQNIVDAGHGKKQASAHKDEKIFSEKFSSAMNHLQSPDSEIKKSRNQYRKTAYAKFVAVLSLLVPLISWVVFQAVLSQESMLSDLIGAHNYGKQLVSLQEEEQEAVDHLNALKAQVKRSKQDISDIKRDKVLTKVTEGRVDYIGIMAQLNSLTLRSLNLTSEEHLAPEINRALGRLTMHNFSGTQDKDGNVHLSISGDVRDAKRMSLTRVTKIIDFINNDPYYTGAELRSFTKSEDESGGARSSFSLSFDYVANEEAAARQEITNS